MFFPNRILLFFWLSVLHGARPAIFADYEAVVPILIKLLDCAWWLRRNSRNWEYHHWVLNLLYLDQVAPMKPKESYSICMDQIHQIAILRILYPSISSDSPAGPANQRTHHWKLPSNVRHVFSSSCPISPRNQRLRRMVQSQGRSCSYGPSYTSKY